MHYHSPLVAFAKFEHYALRCIEETAKDCPLPTKEVTSSDRPIMNEAVKEIESVLQSDGSNKMAVNEFGSKETLI